MGHEATLATEAIQAHQDKQLDEEVLEHTRVTIDLDAEESTCPACFGAIPQGSQRCPSCKLRIG